MSDPTIESLKDNTWNCAKLGRRLSNEFELFGSVYEPYMNDVWSKDSCYETDECDEYELELGEEVIVQGIDALW